MVRQLDGEIVPGLFVAASGNIIICTDILGYPCRAENLVGLHIWEAVFLEGVYILNQVFIRTMSCGICERMLTAKRGEVEEATDLEGSR